MAIKRERVYSIAEYHALLQSQPRSSSASDLRRTSTTSQDMAERDFLGTVRRLAETHGWLVYHTHDSRRSEQGFPDLSCVKPGRLVFAELKSRQGKLTAAQQRWLAMLSRSVPGVEVYTWRPSDMNEILEVLRGKR